MNTEFTRGFIKEALDRGVPPSVALTLLKQANPYLDEFKNLAGIGGEGMANAGRSMPNLGEAASSNLGSLAPKGVSGGNLPRALSTMGLTGAGIGGLGYGGYKGIQAGYNHFHPAQPTGMDRFTGQMSGYADKLRGMIPNIPQSGSPYINHITDWINQNKLTSAGLGLGVPLGLAALSHHNNKRRQDNE